MLEAGLKEQRAGVFGAMLEFVAQRVRNESGLVRPILYDYLANKARTQMLLLGLPFLQSPFNVGGTESRRYRAADPTSFDTADLDVSQRLVRAIYFPRIFCRSGRRLPALQSLPTHTLHCSFWLASSTAPVTPLFFLFPVGI